MAERLSRMSSWVIRKSVPQCGTTFRQATPLPGDPGGHGEELSRQEPCSAIRSFARGSLLNTNVRDGTIRSTSRSRVPRIKWQSSLSPPGAFPLSAYQTPT